MTPADIVLRYMQAVDKTKLLPENKQYVSVSRDQGRTSIA